jgi:hypothetical protein
VGVLQVVIEGTVKNIIKGLLIDSIHSMLEHLAICQLAGVYAALQQSIKEEISASDKPMLKLVSD